MTTTDLSTQSTLADHWRCWICGSSDLTLVKRSNVPTAINSEAFRITDSAYGHTAAIYRCGVCTFLQCPELNDVLGYYEEMVDASYEESRGPRGLQALKLLETVRDWKPNGHLLDVGAGSGILVEQAKALGYEAVGIEPSEWLHKQAKKRGLRVYRGTLPHPGTIGVFDVVTLIDVLEHVGNPVALLRNIRGVMAEDGVGCLVTPNVSSVAARLMGWWWWHYRVAHIGYFSLATLDRALQTAGLHRIAVKRPGWYFPADYLVERVISYLPKALRPPIPKALHRLVIPLNLADSLLVVFTKDN